MVCLSWFCGSGGGGFAKRVEFFSERGNFGAEFVDFGGVAFGVVAFEFRSLELLLQRAVCGRGLGEFGGVLGTEGGDFSDALLCGDEVADVAAGECDHDERNERFGIHNRD